MGLIHSRSCERPGKEKEKKEWGEEKDIQHKLVSHCTRHLSPTELLLDRIQPVRLVRRREGKEDKRKKEMRKEERREIVSCWTAPTRCVNSTRFNAELGAWLAELGSGLDVRNGKKEKRRGNGEGRKKNEREGPSRVNSTRLKLAESSCASQDGSGLVQQPCWCMGLSEEGSERKEREEEERKRRRMTGWLCSCRVDSTHLSWVRHPLLDFNQKGRKQEE